MQDCIVGQREIYEYLKERKEATINDICLAFHVEDKSKIRTRIAGLKRPGLIEVVHIKKEVIIKIS